MSLAPPASPRLRWALRDAITIGSRFRRKHDGAVIIVLNVHRKDGVAECSLEGQRARFPVGFAALRVDHELLVTVTKR